MKRIIIIPILLISNILIAQTGPGGVGSAGSNSLWLKADDIIQSDETPIASWLDISGNSNDATQLTAEYQPRFDSLILNDHAVVKFDGTNDYFDDFRTYDARTFFSVYKVRAGIQQTSDLGQIWGSYSEGWHVAVEARSGARGWSFDGSPGLSSGNTGRLGINGAVYGSFTGNTPTPTWTYDQFQVVSVEFNTTRTLTRQVIGSLVPHFSVGEHQYGGDIAEILVYNTTLNSAQRIIVENYLAAKYGLLLTINDLYDEDDVLNGNYDNEVAGIGRVNASNVHNDAQGGIVRILNPTNLGDDEFLIWGHDNGEQQASNTRDVPDALEARFERVWRVSERNAANTTDVNVGNIDLRWDLNGLGDITVTDLRLLIDNDNDGVFDDETAISGAIDLGGGIYEFHNVSTLDSDERFTLGTINTWQTPLPIDLVYFIATPENNRSVKLEWQTASEINNDFFTIERSLNGLNWEIIKTINAAGNSTKVINYKTTDRDPYSGLSYYRLKQTDFDGQFEYSVSKSVDLNKLIAESVKIYPNPTNNQITVVSNSSELTEVRIFNILGQDVSHLTKIEGINESTLTIDLSELINGMYYVKTRTVVNKVYKQ